jgi:hypothetical protein
MHISSYVRVCMCSLSNLTATSRRDSGGVQRNFVGRRGKPGCDMLRITCASRINASVRKSRIITFSAGLNLTLSRSDNRHVGWCIPWTEWPLKEITPSFGALEINLSNISAWSETAFTNASGTFNCYDRWFLCFVLLTRTVTNRERKEMRERKREENKEKEQQKKRTQ